MKLIYNAILFLFLNTVFAQESNIFLARDFWQTSPTINQVKAEIEKGNSPTEKNANAFDATVYAIISHAPTETIKYLLTLPENPLDKNTHDGRNYLLWAGYAGDFELVKHLIELGSDIKWKDDHGFDLVTFTASGGNLNPDLYELYKSVGFNISESKRNGANALLLVAPNALEIKELDYFVKNGMPLNSEDDNGNTIFHAVAAKGNIPILQNLIEAGVDAKKLNNNNIEGIIVGKAIYDGDIKLDELVKELDA